MAVSVLRSAPNQYGKISQLIIPVCAKAQLGGGEDNDGGWEEGQGQSHMEAISGAFIQKSIKVLVALKLK